MNNTYRFQYKERTSYVLLKIGKKLAFMITLVISINVFLSLFFTFACLHNIIPMPLTIATLVFAILSLAFGLYYLIYFLYDWYNDSITDIHWDFNQEITITGNKVISRLTFKEDTLEEELFITRIVTTKKATIYYQDKHHYVIVPSGIDPVSNKDVQ